MLHEKSSFFKKNVEGIKIWSKNSIFVNLKKFCIS